MAFLSHAGYRLHAQYRAQFVKLLHSVHDDFLPRLEDGHDADARAVATRLRTYLVAGQYLKEPEGRFLKAVDDSSYTRA
jgi:nucleoporin GLE1